MTNGDLDSARMALAQGRLDQAERLYRRALAQGASPEAALAGLADIALAAANPAAAERLTAAALAFGPVGPDRLRAKAQAAFAGPRPDAAAPWVDRLNRVAPDQDWGWLAQGILARQRFNLDDADRALRRAGALSPGAPQAWFHLGALNRNRADASAARYLQRACRLAPDHAEAQWLSAEPLLRLGRLRDGFAAYEWRFAGAGGHHLPDLPMPLWRGEPLGGRDLLVFGEQGFGDCIMFARYLPMLAARSGAGQVHLVVKDPLVALLAASFPTIGVIAYSSIATEPGRLPPAAFFLPMGSLPHLFATDNDTIPAQTPYLTTGRPLPPPGPRFRVGLVWKGNPAHPNDANRSLSAADLDQLTALDNIDWVSLQFGEAAAPQRTAPAAPLGDFVQSAAAVQACDLVIAVDTAIVHLAGALNRPCLVLLPAVPDWRWQYRRGDSPWYPTLRLFRQPAPGDWQGPLRAIAAEVSIRRDAWASNARSADRRS